MKGKLILGSIILILALIVPLSCGSKQEQPQDWVVANETEFLEKCEHCDIEFERYDFGSGTIVYYHGRMIGEARVELDGINYQFDKETGDFKKKTVHWRDDLPDELPPIISEEQALAIGGGTKAYLLYIDPESSVSLVEPTPMNPCWEVYIYEEYHDPETNETFTYNCDVIVVDAVIGEILGHGVPIP